jgi:hypothetical protein
MTKSEHLLFLSRYRLLNTSSFRVGKKNSTHQICYLLVDTNLAGYSLPFYAIFDQGYWRLASDYAFLRAPCVLPKVTLITIAHTRGSLASYINTTNRHWVAGCLGVKMVCFLNSHSVRET